MSSASGTPYQPQWYQLSHWRSSRVAWNHSPSVSKQPALSSCIKCATISLQWILMSIYHQLYQATPDHIIPTNTNSYQQEPSSKPTHSSHVLWSGGTLSQETSWSPCRLRPSRGLWLRASNGSWSFLLALCTIRTFTYAPLMDKVSPLVLHPASWILPSTEVEVEVEASRWALFYSHQFFCILIYFTARLSDTQLLRNVLPGR